MPQQAKRCQQTDMPTVAVSIELLATASSVADMWSTALQKMLSAYLSICRWQLLDAGDGRDVIPSVKRIVFLFFFLPHQKFQIKLPDIIFLHSGLSTGIDIVFHMHAY
jgi:hypothetical protein